MKNKLPLIVFLSILVLIFIAIGGVGAYIYSVATSNADDLPSLEELENPKPDLATTVLSADGEVLDQFFNQRRGWIQYDSIPPDFVKALIATEDRVFFEHWGIHISRIIKASVKNVIFRRREGGSTITQQLARNLYAKIGFSTTLRRKILEAATAIEIEKRYTKQEILEMYTNTVYFGRGAYGIETAARQFFDKDPLMLSTAECAYLVALLKSPRNYDATRFYERALERRNLVLYNMRFMEFIGEGQFRLSLSEDIIFSEPQPYVKGGGIAPHFVEHIRRTLQNDSTITGKYNIYRDGLVIHTTLNARVQRAANKAVEEHFAELQPEFERRWSWAKKQDLANSLIARAAAAHPDVQKAEGSAKEAVKKKLIANIAFRDSVLADAITAQTGFVVLENATGEVRAMVGSSRVGQEGKHNLNRASQIRRQPGSSFKPFVYASALKKGLNPLSTIQCNSFTYPLPEGGEWRLAKNGKNIPDELPLASALKFSVNPAAARLITQYTTPQEVARLAADMGIRSTLPRFPSLALGACEVSPLEMAVAYATFAHQGISLEPLFITRIEDRFGNIIYERKGGRNATNALDPEIAGSMTSMMKQVVVSGTATRIKNFYPHEAAGKTGTTNDFVDAWFAGFTPSLTAAIWIGFDDIRVKFTGDYGQGGRAVAPLWGRVMGNIYSDTVLTYRKKKRFTDIEEIVVPPRDPDAPPIEPNETPIEDDAPDEPSDGQDPASTNRLPSLRTPRN